MPSFNYVAMNDKGAEVNGVVEAESTVGAINQIRDMGYFPTNVVAQSEKAVKGAAAAGRTRKEEKGAGLQMRLKFLERSTVKSKVLAVFIRQLATLIDAGLPLLRSLRVLEEQQKPGPLRDALIGMAESIEGGSTFSEALGNYPKIFDKLFVNMVKAGEAGGVLELVLNRLAEYMEKAQRLKSKVKSAMIYPIFVIALALGVTLFLVTFVVPKFKEIFEDFAITLPRMTQILIRVSTTIKGYAYFDTFPYIGPLIFVPIALFFIIKYLLKTEKGRRGWDIMKLNLPLFGTLVRKAAIARFSRTLGTLITSGVPILQALNIVRDTSGNEIIADAVGSVHDSIREGESIASPLKDTKVFTPLVISMIEVGEQTGQLPEMLMKIADTYDDDVDTAVAGLTSIIEPMLIIFLAFIVGFIVISLFLPLVTMITSFSQTDNG
jgi:type IV pilus assembly protein PilC